ncbi:MAG: insulinase family protein [Firmicutes bacterium]|nr:insulinase family protein [Bacillota bacterium]
MISCYAFLNIGSSDGEEGYEGIAHFCEHMMFAGTSGKDRNQLYNIIGGTGAGFNAFTQRDYSCFHFNVLNDKFISAFEILVKMLFCSEFDPAVVEKEREIILKEIAYEESIEDKRIINSFYEYIFPCEYSAPICGFSETVRKIDIDTLRMFHDKHYRTENLKILIMGDFNEDTILKASEFLISEYGKTLANGRKATLNRRKPVVLLNDNAANCMMMKKIDVSVNYLFLAVKAPGCDSKDFLPFMIFTELIYTSGKLSIESLLVKETEGGIFCVTPYYLFRKDGGYLVIKVSFRSSLSGIGVLNRLKAALAESLDIELSESDVMEFTATEATNRRLGEEKTDLFGIWESQSFMNMKFKDFAGYVDLIMKVSPAEIMHSARKILSGADVYAAVFGNSLENEFLPISGLAVVSEDMSGESSGVETPGGQSVNVSLNNKVPEKPEKYHYENTCEKYFEYVLSSGVKLIVSQDPKSHVFASCVTAGNRCFSEKPGKRGAAELLSGLLSDGYRGKPKEVCQTRANLAGAVINTVYKPPERVSSWLGGQMLCVRIETTEQYSQEAMELISNTVFFPTPETGYFEARRSNLVKRFEENRIKPVYKAHSKLFNKMLGHHPYSFDPGGIGDELNSLEIPDIFELHKELFSPRNLILSVRSSLDPEKVFEMAENNFGADFVKQEGIIISQNLPAVIPFPVKERAGVLYGAEGVSGENSAAAFALFTDIPENEESAFEIISLAFASNLAFRLRDCEGLSYNVSPGWERTGYGSYYIMTAETDRRLLDKTVQIMTEFPALFRKEFMNSASLKKYVEILKCSTLRNLMSSIGKAVAAAVDVLQGYKPGRGQRILESAGLLDPYKVMAQAERFVYSRIEM